MNYDEALETIHSYLKFGSKLGLSRMNELLDRLGRPEKDLRVIHVAGTNGKGSVVRYIYTVLNESGYRAGAYFSPYIEKFTERIECGGQQISEEDLVRYTEIVDEKAKEMVAEGHDSPTEFEIVTAIGFMYFAAQKVDFVVLETGLGGIGDSTNVIEKPLATIITSIDFDHMDVLGDTLPEIAANKAGIFKQGVPAAAFVKDEEARQVCIDKAAELDAPFYDITKAEISDVVKDIEGYSFSADFDMDGEHRSFKNIKLGMAGTHQIENALCALYCIEILRGEGVNIPDQALRSGLEKSKQPARFEIVYKDPYVILDGAHNYAGARALAYTLHEVLDGKNILLCVGILEDKEYQKMAKVLNKLHCDIICTSVPVERGMPAFNLADAFGRVGGFVIGIYDNYMEAFNASVRASDAYDAIVWAGSLYLMGPIRAMFEEGED